MEYDVAKRIAQELTIQLTDPHSPTVCPLCLAEFGSTLAYKHEQHVLNLRADCHDFFNNCVGILTTRRTPEELGRLKSAASIHHRRCKRRRLAGKGAISFATLLEASSLILSTALHSGDRAPIDRAMTTHKAFGDRLSRWPARPEQLYPGGERETVAALVDLAELLICGAPLDALTNCVLIARTAILPVVLVDTNRPRLLSIILKMLMIRPSPAAPWKADPRSIVAAFFEALRRGPGAHGGGDYNRFIVGTELEMYRTIESALSTAPGNMVGLVTLASCCDSAYYALYPPGTTDTARPPPPEYARRISMETARARNIPQFNYGTLMHGLIVEAGASTRCASPACGIAQMQCDRDQPGKKLQVCARCKVPRYCSKACQAHHWKHAVPPHKSACAVLVKFNACAFFERKLGTFDEQYAKTVRELEESEIDALNAWMETTCKEFGLARQLPFEHIDIRKPPAFSSPPSIQSLLPFRLSDCIIS